MQNPPDTALMSPPGSSETEKELYAETKKTFLEDLECLYISGNQGGRLMFADKWPQVAEMIFDPALVGFDHDGVKDDSDREKRAELESKATEKRDEILGYFEGMDKDLVVHGSLQLSALEKIMEKLDRALAELVFSERFVDKYFPNANAPKAPPPAEQPQQSENAAAPLQAQDTPSPEEPTSKSSEDESSPQVPSASHSAEQSATPPPLPQGRPVHKESIVVPDSDVNSIGHVDHTYNASVPDYDAQKTGENEENAEDGASWLDMPEDEFDDVQPISLDAPANPSAPSENGASAQEENKTKPMGLSGHQQNAQSPSVPSPESQENEGENVGVQAQKFSAPQAEQDAQSPSQPPPTPAPRQSGGQAAPPLPGQNNEGLGKPSLPEDNHNAPQQPKPPEEEGSGLRKPSLPDTGSSIAPQSDINANEQGGLRKPQLPEEGQSGLSKPSFPEDRGQHGQQQTPAPSSPPSQPSQPSVPPLPGAAPHPSSSAGNEEEENKNKPRKPSLDDIDSHLGGSGQRPSGPPPLPGKEDDDSLF